MATTNIQSFAGDVEVIGTVTGNGSGLTSLNASNVTSGTISRPVTTTGAVTAASLYTDRYIFHTGDTDTYMDFPSNDTFRIVTAGSERMRVESGGDVGIGTNNPAYKLDVNGTVNATSLYVGGSPLQGSPWTETASSNIYYASNVAIGTNTDPTKTLEVAGPMRITNGGSTVCDLSVGAGNNWDFQSKITSPDYAAGDSFAWVASISGDGSYAIAGAWREDPGGVTDAGSAYVYVRSGSTWSFQTKLMAPDAAASDNFGSSVSLSSDGSYALVGAQADDDGGSGSGSAYIFSRSGVSWSFQSKLTAPDAAASDQFGFIGASISGDGSYALMGVPFDEHTLPLSPGPGSAYIYRRSGTTWSFQSKLTAPDPGYGRTYGIDVSISNDGSYALVGASEGAAMYIYTPQTCLIVSKPITANGTLLSFTGQHICFPEGPMGQGLVVSANKNKYVSLNGSLTTGNRAIKSSEALPVVSLSNVASDPSVFGVVDHFEQSGTTRSQTSGATVITQDKEVGDNRVVVNSLGEGAIWVANTNGNVVSGDFLTTSHLPGYAQRQDDDIVRSCTVAKSTMDCDFEPEELPVQVILKDDDGNNVLDSYGRLQWMDTDRTEPEYRIRYLDVSGVPTDEANAVHKAAYVGCTYHCG